ncbi:MAG TPA: M24 family metallopeptidase [Thermoanaerobaculia bacterium]|nr:M24 family metallopeptidase [Thermoanaerobaculia bacterium]
MLAERITDIQSALADADLDGWLFACFQQIDPVGLDLLSLNGEGKLVTRRCYYLIPRAGEPKKLVHAIESSMLDHLPGGKDVYLPWQEHRKKLGDLVSGCRRIAAQYSPNNELPNISRLDAGTAELLRSFGVELASSADLVQQFAAVWSEEQLAGHRRANVHLHRIALEAFHEVETLLRRGEPADEYTIQRFILESFEKVGLWAESDPIVGVNGHAADPHYQPGPGRSSAIRPGDFLLIDLWAKEKPPTSVYADITWCGVCAAAPTDRQQEVWAAVSGARDASWELVRSRFPHTPIAGWEVDEVGREVIRRAGFGDRFIHRTGHSIGISDHGQGANMDNLETHDTRRLLPMTGFSIEPGVYLTDDFGIRTEINVALTATAAEITGAEPQRELLRLLA